MAENNNRWPQLALNVSPEESGKGLIISAASPTITCQIFLEKAAIRPFMKALEEMEKSLPLIRPATADEITNVERANDKSRS